MSEYKGTYALSDIRLDEVSLVDNPANQSAHVVLFKRASSKAAVEKQIREAVAKLDSIDSEFKSLARRLTALMATLMAMKARQKLPAGQLASLPPTKVPKVPFPIDAGNKGQGETRKRGLTMIESIEKLTGAVAGGRVAEHTSDEYSRAFAKYAEQIREPGEGVSAAWSRAESSEVGSLLKIGYEQADQPEPKVESPAQGDDVATQSLLSKATELSRLGVPMSAAIAQAKQENPELFRASLRERGFSGMPEAA